MSIRVYSLDEEEWYFQSEFMEVLGELYTNGEVVECFIGLSDVRTQEHTISWVEDVESCSILVGGI